MVRNSEAPYLEDWRWIQDSVLESSLDPQFGSSRASGSAEFWDVDKLRECLPDEVVQRIIAMSPPSPWKQTDHVARNLSTDGTFQLKQAYQALIESTAQPDRIFSYIWHWRGPERIRYFLWLCAHNAILTNTERKWRHLTNSASCPRCVVEDETITHVLRDCAFAKGVWSSFLPMDWRNNFFNLNAQEWMMFILSQNSNWQTIFGIATSSL
ncbi:hypothetical protein Ahy_B04g072448 [Arachis hypogaea]|uniref:Reverse transcriptase zinc-binding domain-containing protein n=1 Tax=Arachis hypogaea TaxID=3818 RepID=A0A444ZN08_ARAHY|nr:hypothetical protein Ahy_B04g072448 [Arachis hypogaea]